MPIENIEAFSVALNFLATYFAEKGLDKLADIKSHSPKETSVAEHMYSVLTESLEDFCNKYEIEFDENAISDTHIFEFEEVNKLNCDNTLKLILERATGLEISSEELNVWGEIVQEHLVSDKHEKLFRAIQLKSLADRSNEFIEPKWMKKYMVDNHISLVFEKIDFNQLFADIKTKLSYECWMQTQDLILELSLNAVQHGKAKHITLRITENKLQILDDGALFDIKQLINSDKKLSGGNWTITRYTNNYPEINLSCKVINEQNEITIEFPEKVFDVNCLCEINLPRTMIHRVKDIKLRYPNGKARYYYIDFNDFNAERSFLCMSGACELISKLDEFCTSRNTDVFMYLPRDNMIWDDFYEKISVCFEYGQSANRIHIIRE